MKRTRFPIKQNVYNRSITFLYGTAKEINAALERACPKGDVHEPLTPADVGHWRVYTYHGLDDDFICVVQGHSNAAQLAALGHEVLHHVNYALRAAGLPLTRKSEEAYCYYFQWVFRNCVEAMP